MTRYTLTYEIPPDMLNRAMMSWAKPVPTRAQKWRRFGIGVVAYVVLFLTVLALLRADIVTNQILLGAGIGTVAMLVLWAGIYRNSTRQLSSLVQAAHARHGSVDAIFCAEFVEISSKLSLGRMDWLCFDSIDRLKDATVMRTGGMVYPVPDSALPDGVSPEMFQADLTRWMEAAR